MTEVPDSWTAAAVEDTSGRFLDELTVPATNAGAELALRAEIATLIRALAPVCSRSPASAI